MIYTLTFNPAIDYVMYSDNLKLGKTNRSKKESLFFGGKGINVSRVLKELGTDSVALGFIAGFTGEELERFLNENKIKTDFVKLSKGLTRINIKLKFNDETEINANGPVISQMDIDLLFKKLDNLQKNDTLILAGNVPSSLPENIYEQIMKRLNDKSIRIVVDATGNLLLNCLKYKPFLIKPNKAELEEIIGNKLLSEEEIISAAFSLKEKGACNVLVSLGSDGAILIDEFSKVHVSDAVKINAVNTVGAGDSMVAGFLAGTKESYDYALKLGCAAGSATASLEDLADAKTIYALL